MKNVGYLNIVTFVLTAAFVGFQHQAEPSKSSKEEVQLGNFSVSLTVKDLKTSMEFYQKLGFHQKSGNPAQRWVVMQNETSTIGLFQGMFDKNSLTFNPGWDRDKNTLKEFDDVREIQRELLARGIELTTKTDEAGEGPAYIALQDPDGNPILIDQHVAKPVKK